MRRRISTVLLLIGSAALIWSIIVLAGVALYQHYQSRRLDHIPATSIRGGIGRLEIPSLNLSTIVIEGDDEGALTLGAGHVPSTALPDQPGNVCISAHRDTIFRPLRRIARNDRIELTTPSGAYDYQVESTEIVPPTAVQILNASGSQELTLITCYPFYYVGPAPLRFIVHARRIG